MLLFYVLYIYLTRTVLEVFNCTPTVPPDGQTYLSAVFVPCGVPGGVQMTLLPWAAIGVVVYIVGYPAMAGALLWRNRELIMEDQLLRAKGTGSDRLTNPNAYSTRKRFSRLYYQFKPDYFIWLEAILARKFCIAATYILFNKNPAFQLAAALLILFVAYAAQVKSEVSVRGGGGPTDCSAGGHITPEARPKCVPRPPPSLHCSPTCPPDLSTRCWRRTCSRRTRRRCTPGCAPPLRASRAAAASERGALS